MFFIKVSLLWSKTYFPKKHLKNLIKIKMRQTKILNSQTFIKLIAIMFSQKISNVKKLLFLKLIKHAILNRLIQFLTLAAVILLWVCKMIQRIEKPNKKVIIVLIHSHSSNKSKKRKRLIVSITNKM